MMITPASASTFIGKRYALLKELGRGGMGAVYRARDRLTNQIVALKRVYVPSTQLVFSSLSESTDYNLALVHEFKTLASLRHPNIISVLDYGFDEGGQPYFTMDLLDAPQPITHFAQTQSLESKLDLLIQMLQAINYLHRRDIIHRDLKPDNVQVILEEGRLCVKVLDFGLALARDAQQGDDDRVIGTLAYMAPEMLEGGHVSRAADLYAVGVIAYELFGGKYPFNTTDVVAMLTDIMMTQPNVEALDLDENLTHLLTGLLVKSPENRYTDAGEVIAICARSAKHTYSLESAAVRESFLQAAEFVGREAELDQLSDALSAAAAHQGSSWLIGGESGIGKSRLLDELRIKALVAGIPVLRGQAIVEGGAPYQAWRSIARWLAMATEPLSDDEASVLKALVPEIATILDRTVADAAPLGPQDDQSRLIMTLQAVLERQTTPLLMILEDLHWAVESLEVLKAINQVVEKLPLLIVASYRDDEAPDLPQKLPGTQHLRLKRLDTQQIMQLSSAMLGSTGQQPALVDLIQRETEGNILFIIEVVRELATAAGMLNKIGELTLPSSVFAGGIQRIINARLSRLPAHTRPLLDTAAVVGRMLDIDLMRHLFPNENLDEWLSVCANSAVLEVYEGQWRFSHDKIRDGVLNEIHPQERPALHRRVADGLEALYPDSALHTISLALHWQIAGDAQRELIYAMRAGDQMMATFATSDSQTYYERALALMRADDPRRPALLTRMGEIHSVGDTQKAYQILNEAIILARSAGDFALLAQAYSFMGRMALIREGNPTLSLGYQQQALAAAQQSGSPVALTNAYRQLGNFNIFTGDLDAAVEYLDQSITAAYQTDDRYLIGMAINSQSDALAKRNRGQDHDLALAYSEQVRETGYKTGNRRLVMMGVAHLGLVCLHREQYAAAYAYFSEAYYITQQINDIEQTGKVANYVGICALGMGDTARAEQIFREGLAISLRTRLIPEVLRSIAGLALVFAKDGKPEEGLRLLAFVLHHPRHNQETREFTDKPYQALQAQFSASTTADLIAAGQADDLDAVLARLTQNPG